MGFYIRKSLNFGPLRLNLSRSGIGVSTGIKGFRVGTGPRGNYIHAGMGGFNYRQTLGGTSHRSSRTAPAPIPDSSAMVQMEEIESGKASHMVDQSAAALLAELNSKRAMIRSWPFSLVAIIITLLIAAA